MRIFSIGGTKLTEIKEQQFPLEDEIQRLTEANLHELFYLDFVKSEFELQGFRIDTLAFDNESRGFVIIEYKKDRNPSVMDQGIAYLNLMLKNRSANLRLYFYILFDCSIASPTSLEFTSRLQFPFKKLSNEKIYFQIQICQDHSPHP